MLLTSTDYKLCLAATIEIHGLSYQLAAGYSGATLQRLILILSLAVRIFWLLMALPAICFDKCAQARPQVTSNPTSGQVSITFSNFIKPADIKGN